MRASWLSSLRRRMRRAFVRKSAVAVRAAVAADRRENSLEATRIVRKQEEDDRLDQALIETFPASDPISPYIPSPPCQRFVDPCVL